MEYLRIVIQYKSFTHILKMVLILFHGQTDVERGFSLNEKSIVENMSDKIFYTTVSKRSNALK